MEGALLILTGLKPLIDCTWNLKMGPFNLQSLVGLLMVAAATVEGLRQHKGHWRAFLVVALAIPALTILNGGSMIFTLKYLASYAGFFLVPVLILRARREQLKYLRWAVAISLVVVVASLFLQMAGLIPWQSFDQFGHDFYGKPGLTPSNNIVGRLTGFYYHPLDLARFLAWVFMAVVAECLVYYPAVAGFIFLQYVFLRTTHRTTMIYAVLTTALICFMQSPTNKKRVMSFTALLAVTVLSWWAGITMTKTHTPVGMEDLFNANHFVDARALTSPPGTFEDNHGVQLNMGRGRYRIWVTHGQWVSSTFSAREWLLGSGRTPMNVVDEEPHQQLLDFLERYGLIGTALLVWAFWVGFAAIPAALSLKVAAAVTLVWYGLVTECLVMPTFTWCAALYMTTPFWLRSKRKRA
jgi:hypothetical protein